EQIVKFPVARQKPPAIWQCHGRVLQNRFADDGCNPGPRRWVANANANCHSNTYGYSYTELNANCAPEAAALTKVEPGPKTTANSCAAPVAQLPGCLTGKRGFPKMFFASIAST